MNPTFYSDIHQVTIHQGDLVRSEENDAYYTVVRVGKNWQLHNAQGYHPFGATEIIKQKITVVQRHNRLPLGALTRDELLAPYLERLADTNSGLSQTHRDALLWIVGLLTMNRNRETLRLLHDYVQEFTDELQDFLKRSEELNHFKRDV